MPNQPDPEKIFESAAAFFAQHQLTEHYAVLCHFSWKQRDQIEAAIRARHPLLSATAVDNAAHSVLRRLWHLAPGVALACPAAAEFGIRLRNLLKPCLQFSALDEIRKFQRQQEILDAQLAPDVEAEQNGFSSDSLLPEEVDGLLETLRKELAGAKSDLTLAVLEVLHDYAARPGCPHPAERGAPGTEFICAQLKKRRIYAGLNQIKRARSRLAQIARRLLDEKAGAPT